MLVVVAAVVVVVVVCAFVDAISWRGGVTSWPRSRSRLDALLDYSARGEDAGSPRTDAAKS